MPHYDGPVGALRAKLALDAPPAAASFADRAAFAFWLAPTLALALATLALLAAPVLLLLRALG